MAIEIRLSEDRYYFPGDTIKGEVIIHPKSSTLTSEIALCFTGQVKLDVREKETSVLFRLSKSFPVVGHVLEARQHAWHFSFVVPRHLELPSALEFGQCIRVRYTITAIQHRPMVPESLCPKTTYPVRIMEFIDTDALRYAYPLQQTIDVASLHASSGTQGSIRATMSRSAIPRGDLITLDLYLQRTHWLPKSAEVALVRVIGIRTNKQAVYREDILRSSEYDLTTREYQPTQRVQCNILVPTSTPPTLRFQKTVLRVKYMIRVRVTCIDGTPECTIHMPIIIGTWPHPTVPIDEDDDDDSEPRSQVHKRDSRLSRLRLSMDDYVIGRSDSTVSQISDLSCTSTLSWRSGLSWDSTSSRPPSTAGSLSYSATRSSMRQGSGQGPLSPHPSPCNAPSITPPLSSSPSPTPAHSPPPIQSEDYLSDSSTASDEDDLFSLLQKRKKKQQA